MLRLVAQIRARAKLDIHLAWAGLRPAPVLAVVAITRSEDLLHAAENAFELGRLSAHDQHLVVPHQCFADS